MHTNKEVGVVAIDYVRTFLQGDEDIGRTRENDLDFGVSGANLRCKPQRDVQVEVFLVKLEIMADGTIVLASVAGINDHSEGRKGERTCHEGNNEQ